MRTGQLADNLWALELRVSTAYILRGEGGTIAIDAGLSPSIIARELAKTGSAGDGSDSVAQSDVRSVFLTHSDRDHTGGLPAFGGADVYMSELEEPMVDGSTSRGLLNMKNRPIGRRRNHLVDGQVVETCGHRILAISTPGHTLGSMSYLVDGRYLFVGDAMSLKRGEARPFWPPFLNMDKQRVPESLRKLAGLAGASASGFTGGEGVTIELLCTGHTGCTTDVSEALNGWR